MRRWLILPVFAILAVVALLLASLPFWLGVALEQLGGSRGLTFSRYERLGYARFALQEAEFRRGAVQVRAERAEGPTPLLWLWHHWREHDVEVIVGNWFVEVQRQENEPEAVPGERGWLPLRAQLRRIIAHLDNWLPRARVGPGAVRWPGGELTLSRAIWSDRGLVAENVSFLGYSADLQASWPEVEDRLRLSLQAGDDRAELESHGGVIHGEISWWGQRAPVHATFAAQGWLPAEASLQATRWHIPAARLKLGELYEAVRGDARLEWHQGEFAAEVAAEGEPVPGRSAPPLEVNLRATGTPEVVTVEALQATVPGLRAELSAPVAVERSGRVREGGARFTLDLDLAQQPWFEARGRVSGEATLVSAAREMPQAQFRFEALDVAAHGVDLAEVKLEGAFDWPRIQVTNAIATGAGGEQLIARGGWDFKARAVLDAALDGRIRRTSLARWLPAQPEFDTIVLAAAASGPAAELEHRGHAEVERLAFPGVHPLAARIEWHGRGAAAENFRANLGAGQSSVVLGGTADRNEVQFRQLTLARGGQPLLELMAPAVLRWHPALQLESLRLAGPEGALDASLIWGTAGRLEASARDIPSTWLADFVPQRGPAWTLHLFAFSGAWNHGPMDFALTIGAAIGLGEGRAAAINAAGRGDGSGVRIEALRATESETTVFNANGQIPATIHPGTAKILRIDPRGKLALDATAVPHAAFWSKLAAATGVELRDPQAAVNVTGTWERPEGDVSLKAARILIDQQRVKRELPAIGSLTVQLSAARTGIDLKEFALAIEGQPVRARGRLPVPDGGWARLAKEPLQVLRRDGSLHVEVPEAEISVFARFLPAVLAPQGRIHADVTFDGGELGGRLRLRNAASRPLGPLGVLQEINAEVGLEGRKLNLHSVGAKSGGQPVTLTGQVEIPEQGRPRFNLALQGQNLPFVRQPGLLLRGDLDLKLQSPKQDGPPRITGLVRLRDSLFLQDVRAFLPRGGGGPTKRPPYFSVETPPLNGWLLAVEVSGDEFMRMRTPVFNGVASAHFRLGGTLGEPRAFGEFVVDSGMIRMPFASFEVRQGSVRLTEANPVEPVVYLRGTSRRFGYDLSVEIEGNASSPNVEFTSSPALDSEEVLLMVMTGAAPSDEITYSGTQRVARLGAFLGQSILGTLGADSGNADRLSIASGEKISRQGKETYEIEYKLSDRWTAIGEYNEFDEYNAGVKWRIYPRREQPTTGDDVTERGTDAGR